MVGPGTVVRWEEPADALAGAGLLVNSTSLGMAGQPPLDVALAALPRDAVVADLVYRLLQTDLLQQARARGCVVIDGLGMLLHQASPCFDAWFGPARSDAQQSELQALQSTSYARY